MDESFFALERRRAQAVSKGILGFGSQPADAYGGSDTCEKKCSTQPAGTFPLKMEKAAHFVHDQKNGSLDSDPSSPTSQRSSSWSTSLVRTHEILLFLRCNTICTWDPCLLLSSFEMSDIECNTVTDVEFVTAEIYC